MTRPNASNPKNAPEAKLPRRDWILLPTISLLTISLLAGSVELITRRIYTRFGTPGEACMVFTDPSTGARGIPDSVCREKIAEGEPMEYRFNSSGYRADEEFGPKQPGIYRIVLIGASSVLGMRVPREKTFAALLPLELARRIGIKVQLYNEAIPYRLPNTIALHFDEALKAKPDMVLWAVHVGDIQSQSQVVMPAPYKAEHHSLPVRAWLSVKETLVSKSFAVAMSEIFSHTRTATLLFQIMYGSPSQYVKSSLMETGKVEYLRAEPDTEWQKRLDEFDSSAARIEAQAKDAGVPLVVVLLPNHAQTAMILRGEWPAGFDPYKLDEELRSIITSHGGTYIDIFPDIRTIPDADKGYFPVEGHPNNRGHAIFSELLTKELTSGAVPALSAANHPQAAVAQGR